MSDFEEICRNLKKWVTEAQRTEEDVSKSLKELSGVIEAGNTMAGAIKSGVEASLKQLEHGANLLLSDAKSNQARQDRLAECLLMARNAYQMAILANKEGTQAQAQMNDIALAQPATLIGQVTAEGIALETQPEIDSLRMRLAKIWQVLIEDEELDENDPWAGLKASEAQERPISSELLAPHPIAVTFSQQKDLEEE